MKQDTNILAALKTVAPTLATINNTMPYALPSGYFDGLSEAITAQISANNLPKIELPFTVPQHYFASLNSNVLAAIAKEATNKNEAIEELETIAPLLNTIGKTNIYTLPKAYFTTFNTNLFDAIFTAKVVSISLFKRKMLYVAAACVIGIMAISAFIFTNNIEKIDYAAYKQIDVNSTINKISNDELVNYLENVNAITNANTVTSIDVKLPDIQEHIQLVSDEELKQYLKETDVPSSEEYLLGI
ncbi:MAG: hypothetical protein QM541_03900 [Flavobacterium sp.]|nr:hypothetical protein [Flavobacterium sp.]